MRTYTKDDLLKWLKADIAYHKLIKKREEFVTDMNVSLAEQLQIQSDLEEGLLEFKDDFSYDKPKNVLIGANMLKVSLIRPMTSGNDWDIITIKRTRMDEVVETK